ncbi:MAG: hypothetical protein J3K34DRAFT_8638 [Monoraphidium minutum]|nr:MAG: hypothetical protein J3K34DRAFT_8638 [Monoraphidium minutum]
MLSQVDLVSRSALRPRRGPAWSERRAGSIPAPLRPRRRRRAAASPSDAEFEGVTGGDEELQAAIEDQLRLQLKSETIKESIKDDLRSKVEEVKQISEELQAQLDEGYRIEQFRNDIETQETLASAMQQFNELEDEIAAMKQQQQADREELAQWERTSAAARSKGLFFKTLYKPDADATAAAPGGLQRQGGDGGGGGRFGGEVKGSLDPAVAAAAARRAAAKVREPAEAEVGSPLRLWLFAYMAGVLALVVANDFATGFPALGLDALYGVIALVLGINAWNERKLLVAAQAARAREGEGSDGAPPSA